MKVKISIIIAFSTLMFGCYSTTQSSISTSETVYNTSEASISQNTPENIEEQVLNLTQEQKTEYSLKYFSPLLTAGILSKTWDDANKIPINSLIEFYEFNKFSEMSKDIVKSNPEKYSSGNAVADISSSDVENYIQKYFNVDIEYLRTAENYNKLTNTYSFAIYNGRGGGPMKIDKISKKGSELLINWIDDFGSKGLLTIKMEDSDNFKYISNIWLEKGNIP